LQSTNQSRETKEPKYNQLINHLVNLNIEVNCNEKAEIISESNLSLPLHMEQEFVLYCI